MPRLLTISRRRRVAIFCAAVLICVCAGSFLSAAQADDAAPRVDFARDIAPLLVKKCLGCHAGNDPAGGLNLTGRDRVLAGGESGAAVVAGKADESPLLDRVRQGEMPPPEKGEHLTEAEVSRLASWIADGATWPADRVLSPYEFSTEKRAGLDWWSLQALVRPDVPAQATDWGRNAIDAFVARGLVAAGLGPTPEADRRTLLRRATFDLLGLPPTPE